MTYKTDPGRIGNHEPSLDSLHLQTTARPFLDDVAPTRPNNRRLSSIIGSTARRCRIVEQEPHQAPVASAIPTHISKAVPICTSTLDESWSLHSCPILLCDNDGTFHSPLASIPLPIPFPDYSQHLQHQQHFSCPLPPHAAYSLNLPICSQHRVTRSKVKQAKTWSKQWHWSALRGDSPLQPQRSISTLSKNQRRLHS